MKWRLLKSLRRRCEEQNYMGGLCLLTCVLGVFQTVGVAVYAMIHLQSENRIIAWDISIDILFIFSAFLPLCASWLNCRGKVTAWYLLIFEGALFTFGIVSIVLDTSFFGSGLFAALALLLLCAPAALGLWLGLRSLRHSQLPPWTLPLSVQGGLLDDDGNTGRYSDNDDNSSEDVRQENTCLLTDDVDGPLAQAFQAYVQRDILISSTHSASSPTHSPDIIATDSSSQGNIQGSTPHHNNLSDIITAGPSSLGHIESYSQPQSSLPENTKRKSVIGGTTDRDTTDQNTTFSSLPTLDADLVQLDYETSLAWNAHWSYFHSRLLLAFALPLLFSLSLVYLCVTAYSVRWYEIHGHKMPRLFIFLLIQPSLTILYSITTPLLLLTLRYQNWLLSRIIPGMQSVLWAITLFVQFTVEDPNQICYTTKFLSSFFIVAIMPYHVSRMDFRPSRRTPVYDNVGNVIPRW